MRVISGTAKGHKLFSPPGHKTRPTGDRMKEDLFNILAPEVKGALFLDLYCGSGAIGIEALSRGAESAVFVDSSKAAISAARANLEKTRLIDRARFMHMPVESALEAFDAPFDMIFIDPPYTSGDLGPALRLINQRGLLSENGILVAECPIDFEFDDLELNKGIPIKIFRQKKY